MKKPSVKFYLEKKNDPKKEAPIFVYIRSSQAEIVGLPTSTRDKIDRLKAKKISKIFSTEIARLSAPRSFLKLATGWRCAAKDWRNGRLIERLDEFGVNGKMEALRSFVISMASQTGKIRIEDVENHIDQSNNMDLRNTEINRMDVFIKDFIEKSNRRPNTKKAYSTTLDLLDRFCSSGIHKLTFDAITLDFYHDFVDFLWSTGMNDNSVGKYVKTLKTFMREAFDRDLHSNLSFRKKQFQVFKYEGDEVALDADEVSRIWALNLSDNRILEEYRDLFVFACWTGVRFGDLTRIRANHITQDPSGKTIRITTEKTIEPVVIPLHFIAERILDKYNGQLPAISYNQNVQFNREIKEIVRQADIITPTQSRRVVRRESQVEWLPKYKLVSAHTARRSFATNCYLAGIPVRSIMQITGHKTEKSFNRYLRIGKEEHAQIMRSYFQNFSVLKTA